MLKNTSERAPAPVAASDLLCEVARQWLQRRGWLGEVELVRVGASAEEGQSERVMRSWVFDVGEVDGEPMRLRCRFPPGSAPELADAALIQSYLRAAFWMSQQQRDASLSPRGRWVLAQRLEVEKQLHDIGNRLNSLIANTAVLATVHREDERLGRFASQAARDGDACALMLASLSKTLLETRT